MLPRATSRRELLTRGSMGFGMMALAGMLADETRAAGAPTIATRRSSLARSVLVRHVLLLRSRRTETRLKNFAARARFARACVSRQGGIESGVALQTTRSPHPLAFESSSSATHPA